MFCGKCGTNVNPGAAFCPKCGQRVTAPQQPAAGQQPRPQPQPQPQPQRAPAPQWQPQPGQPARPPQAGYAPQAGPAAPPAPAAAPKPKGSPVKWIVIALAAVILLAGISVGAVIGIRKLAAMKNGGAQAEEEPTARLAADETAATERRPDATEADPAESPRDDGTPLSEVRIGLICLHDVNSTYDLGFIQALKNAQDELGLSDAQVIIKTNVDESAACYDAACDLAEQGCNIVVSDSFGHDSFMKQAALEYPEVQFFAATGTAAVPAGVPNFHNAFAAIHEGRYLTGVVAGMKLNAMIEAGEIRPDEAVLGYVGAFPYPEVISAYTAFFLGARSVCETASMKVEYVNSWFDIDLEKTAAEDLIRSGCVLISQHSDSNGAPKACEAAGVPNAAYNVDTASIAPNTALVACRITAS